MIDELCKQLRKDPELYDAYQANITMAFKDEMERSGVHSPNPDNHSILVTRDMLHKIANQAAKNFLDLLIKPREIEVNKDMLRKLLDEGKLSMEEYVIILNQ